MSEAHFNGLSPAEAERLALLLEELGEAQQAIGKILRHGYESSHPAGGETNRVALEREIGDVWCAIEMMFSAGDLNALSATAASELKALRVHHYLHHQPQRLVP